MSASFVERKTCRYVGLRIWRERQTVGLAFCCHLVRIYTKYEGNVRQGLCVYLGCRRILALQVSYILTRGVGAGYTARVSEITPLLRRYFFIRLHKMRKGHGHSRCVTFPPYIIRLRYPVQPLTHTAPVMRPVDLRSWPVLATRTPALCQFTQT